MNITALDFVSQFDPQEHVLLDVRSEGEFYDGHLSHAVNIPILNNEHRHQVGLCYKENGQENAIKLGHQLVDSIKNKLVKSWCDLESSKKMFAHCWRGGLRSQLASQWIRENNREVITIEGGYKAVRNRLAQQFEKQYPFMVVTGLTGCGKTHFLHSLEENLYIDLEAIAHHRGSAFGVIPSERPMQQTFENELAFQLFHQEGFFLLEDESRMIGGLKIPDPFFIQMQSASYLVLDSTLEERMESIYLDYIEKSQLGPESLEQQMLHSLNRIKVRLGGARFKVLEDVMKRAFSYSDKSLHMEWIKVLLENYYDPSYSKRIEKINDRIVYRGKRQELHEFISNRARGSGPR